MSDLEISYLEDRVSDITAAYIRLRDEKQSIENERNDLRAKNRELRKRIESILDRVRSLELEQQT